MLVSFFTINLTDIEASEPPSKFFDVEVLLGGSLVFLKLKRHLILQD